MSFNGTMSFNASSMSSQDRLSKKEKDELQSKIENLVETNSNLYASFEKEILKDYFVANYQLRLYEELQKMNSFNQDLVMMIKPNEDYKKKAVELYLSRMAGLNSSMGTLTKPSAEPQENILEEIEKIIQKLIETLQSKQEQVDLPSDWNNGKSNGFKNTEAIVSTLIDKLKILVNPTAHLKLDKATATVGTETNTSGSDSSTLNISLNPLSIKIPLPYLGNNMNHQGMQKKNETLQGNIKDNEKTIHCLKEELKEQKQICESLEKKLEEKPDLSSLEAEMMKLKAENEEVRESYKKLKTEFEQNKENYNRRFAVNAKTIDRLKRQLKEAQEKQEVKALQSKNSDLLKRNDSLMKSHEALEGEKKSLESQRDTTHGLLQKALARENSLEQEVLKAANLQGNLQASSQRLENLNSELSSELKKTKQELKMCENELLKYREATNKKANAKVSKLEDTNPFKKLAMPGDNKNQTTFDDTYWYKDMQETIREKDEELLKAKEHINLLKQTQM